MKRCAVDGVELAVREEGRGPPLLVVHGFPLNHAMWNAQIDVLARRHRVIAPDLRGFGQSGVTPGVVTMPQFADDLAALLDAMAVGEPVVYCGLSMGGYIAWQFWRNYSGRLKAMVLCDTRAAADTPEAAANRFALADRVLGEGPSAAVETMLPRLLSAPTVQHRPEVGDAIRAMIMGNDPEGIAAASRGMAQRPDMTPHLGQIRCPVLLVVGALDAISPPDEMRSIAAAIPGACLVQIADAGHMSPMEKPAEVTAAMTEFLAAVSVGA